MDSSLPSCAGTKLQVPIVSTSLFVFNLRWFLVCTLCSAFEQASTFVFLEIQPLTSCSGSKKSRIEQSIHSDKVGLGIIWMLGHDGDDFDFGGHGLGANSCRGNYLVVG
jgi:hypothetical protein